MTRVWDGPALKRAIEWRCFQGVRAGVAHYEYLYDGAPAPAVGSTQIRIEAHYVATGEPLDALEQALQERPGCVETTRITGHPELRPQVVALFDRHVAP